MFAGGRHFNRSSTRPNGELVATVDVYDLETKTWSVSRLSEPREFLAGAAIGDYIVFAGGNREVHGSKIHSDQTGRNKRQNRTLTNC